jgi:beta-glucanase (GH16 family)
MVQVKDGELLVSGVGKDPTGLTNIAGGVCWCRPGSPIRKYGVWEVRARFDTGSGYGAVLGLWPDAGNDMVQGKVAIARVDGPARDRMYSVMRGRDGNNVDGTAVMGTFAAWHTYRVEWRAESVRVLVDGALVFDSGTLDRPVIVPAKPMYLYLQLEPGPSDHVPAATNDTPDVVAMHVDWARYATH